MDFGTLSRIIYQLSNTVDTNHFSLRHAQTALTPGSEKPLSRTSGGETWLARQIEDSLSLKTSANECISRYNSPDKATVSTGTVVHMLKTVCARMVDMISGFLWNCK